MYSLDEISKASVPIAQKYGIKRLGLFGSYARGEAREDSDLDFIIDEGELHGLLRYMSFVLELEDRFGCHVDVVMDGIDDTAFLERIKADEVVLYDAG